MKMRKILSFVLVLSLVLGSFSMAFAATPATSLSDIAGIVNEEAVQVNADLGIITGFPDGTFLPEKTVTRAEFAAMITRALAVPESALAGYTSTTFKDTAGYGWAVPYLAFAQTKGIMIGDGQGNAMPGRTINVNEAMTMVLRAIGYVNHSSVLVGAWPANYVTVAQNVGLYDDVAAAVTVDRANAAQIIYNALTVQKVAVNTDGATTYLTVGTPAVEATLLNTGLGATAMKGVMGNDFGGDALINVNKYLGQYGTAYVNSDDEVVAFSSSSTQLVGTFLATTDWSDGFNTTDANVDYINNSTTSGISYFENGALDATPPSAAADTDTQYIINAEVSGKTIKKLYSVMLWTVDEDAKVTASQLKDITDDKSLLGLDFTLNDDDEIDLDSFALIGVSSLDKIEANNVVYVYASAGEITRIEVGTTVVEDVVRDFKAADKAFKIGSTAYKNAEYIINGIESNKNITVDEVGDTVKAYLDGWGYVYKFDNQTTSADTIAFVDAKDSTGLNYAARLILNDGSSKVVNAKDQATADKLIVNSLMKYGLNKDGEISTVSTLVTSSGIAATTTFSSTTLIKGIAGTPSGLVIKSNAIVFTYDSGTDWTAGDYDVTTIDKVNTNEALTGNVQVLLEDGKVIAIIMSANDCSGGGQDTYAVVNDLYTTTNAAGDKVQRVEGFRDGAKLDILTDTTGVVTGLNGVSYNTTGSAFAPELFKFRTDANGAVTKSTEVITNVVAGFVATSADGRNSVATTGNVYALASNVVVYEVNSDSDYKVYTGDIKAGDTVVLYETDDDFDGYDIVIINRLERL